MSSPIVAHAATLAATPRPIPEPISPAAGVEIYEDGDKREPAHAWWGDDDAIEEAAFQHALATEDTRDEHNAD